MAPAWPLTAAWPVRRHVIMHMLCEPGLSTGDVGELAHDHEMVSVLFADVGAGVRRGGFRVLGVLRV